MTRGGGGVAGAVKVAGMVGRQEPLLARHGPSVTLHDVESIIKQLSIRLRLESVIVDHCCCCWVITLLTGWRRPDIVVSGPRVQGGGVGHAVGGGHGGRAEAIQEVGG